MMTFGSAIKWGNDRVGMIAFASPPLMNAPIASVDIPTEWKFLPRVESSGEPSGTAATSCGVIKHSLRVIKHSLRVIKH